MSGDPITPATIYLQPACADCVCDPQGEWPGICPGASCPYRGDSEAGEAEEE